MKYLILTDVHANLYALEAVLSTPEAASCGRICSLGDHLNYGPHPRQVQDRLESLGTMFLMGNHEERLTHLDDFEGCNWNLLKWTAARIDHLPPLPLDRQLGPVWLTHGTPGDPYHLIREKDVAAALDALPPGYTCLISGHNHHPWLVRHQGKTGLNPGACGMLEDGSGGQAAFAVLEISGGEAEVTRHTVPYDVRRLRADFLDSGMAAADPVFARIAYHTMSTGAYHAVLYLTRHVRAVGERMGLLFGDERVWAEADRTYSGWPEPMDSRAYWAQTIVDTEETEE